jgi:hypothetical protein
VLEMVQLEDDGMLFRDAKLIWLVLEIHGEVLGLGRLG